MVEEPWGPFDPSSTARMCLRGYNWVKNRPRSLSGLILMISEASETQLKQIFGLVWHVTDNNNIVQGVHKKVAQPQNVCIYQAKLVL